RRSWPGRRSDRESKNREKLVGKSPVDALFSPVPRPVLGPVHCPAPAGKRSLSSTSRMLRRSLRAAGDRGRGRLSLFKHGAAVANGLTLVGAARSDNVITHRRDK